VRREGTYQKRVPQLWVPGQGVEVESDIHCSGYLGGHATQNSDKMRGIAAQIRQFHTPL